MKSTLLVAFVVSYFGTVSSYAQSCQNLFLESYGPAPLIIEDLTSQSKRVEIQKIMNSTQVEKLTLEQMDFSKDPDQASIELMSLLLQNSSYILEEKNVLTKNELTIGIAAKDGYFFEVTYKAVANERSQFIVDKVSLKTPTGTDSKKIAEGILMPNEVKLKKTDFDLGPVLGNGIHAKLKIPLIIEGTLLTKIDSLARFFEYFRKDEMRSLLQTDSILKIRAVFEYRRAKDVFFKVLFKEPMKVVIGFGFIMMATGNPLPFQKGPEQPVAQQIAAVMPADNVNIIQNRINGIKVPLNAHQLKAEVTELNKQVRSHFNTTKTYSGPKFSEILLDTSNSFSRAHQTWIFEQVDPYNKSLHTYIVFAEDKISVAGPGIQYMVMEIEATKYPELIKFIKAQGQITTTNSMGNQI